MQDIARQTIAIAQDGLKRRASGYGGEADETRFLEELIEIAETGVTPAEILLDQFNGPWQGNIDKVFEVSCVPVELQPAPQPQSARRLPVRYRADRVTCGCRL